MQKSTHINGLIIWNRVIYSDETFAFSASDDIPHRVSKLVVIVSIDKLPSLANFPSVSKRIISDFPKNLF